MNLVEAFDRLLQLPGTPSCRLRAAGYLADASYLEKIRVTVQRMGWADRFEYVGEVDHAEKIKFLQSLDVFSVPTIYKECKGLYVLEAWAAGIPVVQPRHGAFPELLDATDGGLLVNPQDPEDLALGLHRLLNDREARERNGRQGQGAVRQRFHAQRMADETVQVFQKSLVRNLSHELCLQQ